MEVIMDNRILKSGNWQQRIRTKLGVDMAYLPDSDIEMPENITVAEANIIKVCPDYSSLTNDDKVYLQSAVVCECARLICPSMSVRLPKKEQSSLYSVELDIDWEKRAEDLAVERDIVIGQISTVDTGGTGFYGFDLSGRV
jgi:hypothetical protein